MRNKELADKFKGKPCVICGRPGEGDHIKHYAGNPERDVEENMWALCRPHHQMKHKLPLSEFVYRFGLTEHLLKRGFKWDEFSQRWWLPGKVGWDGRD